MKNHFSHIVWIACIAICLQGQSSPIYVRSGAQGGGTSWADACSLEDAMMVVSAPLNDRTLVAERSRSATSLNDRVSPLPETEIWMQKGTYYLSKTLIVPASVKIYGGFSGNETLLSQRDYAKNPTILDAQRNGGVIRLESQALLSGLTLQNGLANTPAQSHGGGVWMENNATIENCYLLNNIALDYGGGIYAEGDGRVFNTVVAYNKAGKDGAAIYGTTLQVTNSTISENELMQCSNGNDTVLLQNVCSGSSVELTVWEAGTYLWNTGETTASINTEKLMSDAVYTCIVTSPDRNCTYTTHYIITVKPLPTLQIATSKNIANVGETCKFTATATPSGGTYLWDDGNATTDSTLTATMPDVGNLQYHCTYTLDGCTTTAYATITNTECTVPEKPDSIVADYPVACASDFVNLKIYGGALHSGHWVLYANTCGGTKLDSSDIVKTPTFQVKPSQTTTYYVRGEGCGQQTSCDSVTVTINPLPAQIVGDSALCANASASYTNNSAGGAWSTASPYFSVDASGLVSGISAGSGKLVYTLPTGCKVEKNITIKDIPAAISGENNLCQGSTAVYTSTPGGGTWFWQTPTSIATLDTLSGTVTAVNTGTAVLAYQHPSTGCVVTKTITVDSLPVKTTGGGTREVCQFDSIQLTNATANGIWQVAPTNLAQITPTGMLSGLLPGEVTVSYRLGNCADTFNVRVNQGVPWVTVASQLCEGMTIQATCPMVPGGVWGTPNPDTAAVEPTTGYIKGLKAGTFDLTYTLPNGGCSRTFGPIYVNPLPAPIVGKRALGVGYTTPLSTTTGYGVWLSNNPNIAKIDPETGIVTGVSEGLATLRYEILATGCRDTFNIQVNPCAVLTPISEASTFDQTVCYNYDEADNFSFKPVVVSATNVTETSITWYNNVKPSGVSYDSLNYTLSGIPKQSGEFIYGIYAVNQKAGCPYVFISGRIFVFDSLKGGTIDTNQAVCYGERFEELTNKVSGSGGNPTSIAYQWEKSLDGNFTPVSGANQLTYNETASVLTDLYYRRRYVNACGEVLSNVVKITVNPLPAKPTGTSTPDNTCGGTSDGEIIIHAEPSGNYEYSEDGVYFFSWDPVADGQNIGIGPFSQGIYTIYKRDTVTGCVSSDTVSVSSIQITPKIYGFKVMVNGNESADKLICEREIGNPFSITVLDDEADAAVSYTYEWNNDSTGKTMQTIVPNSDDEEYEVTVENAGGCISTAKVLIRIMQPITIIENMERQRYCLGEVYAPLSVNVSIPADNITSMANITYQWYQSSDSVVWSEIPDATNSNYSVPNNAASNLLYHVVVNPHNGVCEPVTSSDVRIRVDSLPTITHVVPDTICGSGQAELFATTNYAGNSQVKWYTAEHGGTLLGTTLSGAKFTTGNITATTTYWAEASHETCLSTNRIPVTASVLTEHALIQTSLPATLDQNLCSGMAIDAISFSIGGGATGGTVTWSPHAPNGIVASPLSIYGTTYNSSISNDSTYTWTITTTGNACLPKTATGTITVNHLPGTTTLIADAQGCDSLVLTAMGQGGKIYYQGTTNLGTSTNLPDTIQTVKESGTYYFRAVSSKGCWGIQGSQAVTIYNRPMFTQNPDSINRMTIPIVPFQTLAVTATGSEPLSYQWYSVSSDTSVITALAALDTFTPDNSETAIGHDLYFFCVVSNYAACPADTSDFSGLHIVTPEVSGCDNEIPGWGNGGLGEVHFVTDQTWEIGTQIWSDIVSASNCKKTTYSGEQQNANLNSADCRTNPTLEGDLFSWCAVMRFEHQICPAGWRIPTKTDFINLDLAMGGTGNENTNAPDLLNKYMSSVWGGVYTGYCDNIGKIWNIWEEDKRAYYWSTTQSGSSNGYNLHFNDAQNVYARKVNKKCNGFNVRCVRNK